MHIYIDGENLRHRLIEVLWQEHLIEGGDQPFKFDVHALLESALGEGPEEIWYYTSRVKQPKFDIPQHLADKITSIQEQNRRWIAELTNQGVHVVKGGNLKVHETPPCMHCGKRSQVLQEKGVDVRFATDLVLASTRDDVRRMVVLSSDADMIPALEVVRHNNTEVTYLCFGEEMNHAVAQSVDRVVTYDRDHVIDIFRRQDKVYAEA